MIKVTIEEKDNGYRLIIEGANHNKDSVYKSVEVLNMLEELGKTLYGKKVKVQES